MFYANESKENAIILYRGTKSDHPNLDINSIGSGYDQEGPGLYFTTDKNDAKRYGDIVKQYLFSPKKLIPTTMPPSKKEITWLMKHSPELNDALENWAENKNAAFNMALQSMLNVDTQFEAFLNVWYDFYKNNSVAFALNVVELGYDGVEINKIDNIKHYVIYNISTLREL